MHVIFHDIQHIVILVMNFHLADSAAVFAIQSFRDGTDQFFFLFELIVVMIPDDIGHGSLFHRSGQFVQHEEPFIAFRMFRPLVFRKPGIEFHGHQRGIDHNVLGGAGMDTCSVNLHFCLCGIEVFIFHDAEFSSVHRVGFIRRKTGPVKMGGSVADLLVRCEGDAKRTVRQFGVTVKILYHVHDLRHAGLVIRTEKRCSVRGDQRLAHVVSKLRKSIHGQGGIRTVIGIDDARLHIGAGNSRRSIHVGDKTQRRLLAGKNCIHIAVFLVIVHLRAKMTKFIRQLSGEMILFCRGRRSSGVLIGLSVVLHIAQKTVKQRFIGVDQRCVVHSICSFEIMYSF